MRTAIFYRGRGWVGAFLFLMLHTSIADDYSCPEGWSRFQDTCFFFSKSRASWHSASYVCAELGGTLAHLNTKEKSDFLEGRALNGAYVGCVHDRNVRFLDGQFHYSDKMTNTFCAEKCRQSSYTYSGTQCFCGNVSWEKFQSYGLSPEDECRLPCHGNRQEWCGGHWRSSVYITGGRKHWVGGTDMIEEGKWAWFPGNVPVTYTDWQPTEPDNKLHATLEKEHCMALSPSLHGFYKWSDEICSELLYFVCERVAVRSLG
ncbi:uncharacterized protein LOC111105829 isoform X2 [Crassostrea virginica]